MKLFTIYIYNNYTHQKDVYDCGGAEVVATERINHIVEQLKNHAPLGMIVRHNGLKSVVDQYNIFN